MVYLSTYQCECAETYLISELHEDVISDLAKGQPQVNDVILCAASSGRLQIWTRGRACFPWAN